MKPYLRNPLSEYLRYLWNRFHNRRAFSNFDQGYMTLVERTKCGPNFRVGSHSLITNCRIGGCTYVSHHTEIFGAEIGKFCSIGQGCRIGLGVHPTHLISTSPVFYSTKMQAGITFVSADQFEESQEIRIGNDVWVGANATILDGVQIGTGAVIGAGAVVTRNVDPYTLTGGVPAVAKRKRFSDDQIERLLSSHWWDWTEEELMKCSAKFSTANRFFDEMR